MDYNMDNCNSKDDTFCNNKGSSNNHNSEIFYGMGDSTSDSTLVSPD